MEVLPAAGHSDGRDKVPKYLKKSSIIMAEEDQQSVNGDSTLLSQVGKVDQFHCHFHDDDDDIEDDDLTRPD